MYNRLVPAVPLATPVADSVLISVSKDALNFLAKKVKELDSDTDTKIINAYKRASDALNLAIRDRKYLLDDLNVVKEYLHEIGDSRTVKELVYQSRQKPKGWSQEIEDNENLKRDKAMDAWRKVMAQRQKHTSYNALVKNLKQDELAISKSGSIQSVGSQFLTGMGLLLTVVSATLLGYFAGQRLFGKESPMVSDLCSAIPLCMLSFVLSMISSLLSILGSYSNCCLWWWYSFT